MNCQQFAEYAEPLALQLPLDDATRARALAHAHQCPRCRASLGDQQIAVTGLHALTIAEREVQAPAHLGAALQAAFARQHAPALQVQPVNATWSLRWWQTLFSWRMATVAALLAIGVISGAKWFWFAKTTPSQPPVPVIARTETKETIQAPSTTPAQAVEKVTPHVAQHLPRRARAIRRASEDNGMLLSLVPNTSSEPDEFQQVVRMQIPRATLRLWGLPVNEESSAEQVSAEVIFSEDGVARAIRLRNEK